MGKKVQKIDRKSRKNIQNHVKTDLEYDEIIKNYRKLDKNIAKSG